MKIPLTPPSYIDLLNQLRAERVQTVFSAVREHDEPEYLHWDKLRHLPPPGDLNHEEWWLALKLGRQQNSRQIKGFLGVRGRPFSYCLPDCVLEAVHDIDSRARGHIAVTDKVTNTDDRNRYMVSSLIEEAITSSQLEGAATTRKVAAEMLRTGRAPQDHSEQMILNNYRAMQHILQLDKERLTPDAVQELHRIVVRDTLENMDAEGRLQRPEDERVKVVDNRDGTVLHTPPSATDLPDRIALMCGFANGEIKTSGFMHPVIRAIILHFWLAYDHPFEDGNGRAARALFYWAMLKEGYWLFEYLSISSLLRQAPSQYGKSFLYTETDDNDLTYFIAYQLSIIQRSLDALDDYLARKTREIKEAEAKIKGAAWMNHRQRALIAHAIRNPGHEYSFESHRRSHAVAYATARADLLQLADRKMLKMGKIGKKIVFRPGAKLLQG